MEIIMKKIIAIILAIIICAGIVVLCITCGKKHEHTYSDEWTSDETHHWHTATCEHTDEVSDKAEHTYGEDKKCTVCQKAYIPVATATAETWQQEIGDIENATNIKVTALVTWDGKTSANSIIEIDGSKYCATKYDSDGFNERLIMEKTADNTYDYYRQREENGAWTKKVPEDWEIEQFTGFLAQYADMAKIAADHFADAAFDSATNTYTLNIESATIQDLPIPATNMVYTITFSDGRLTRLNLKFAMDRMGYDMDFEFGDVSVTIPQV